MVDVPTGHLFLGDTVDPASHERVDDPIMLEASDLTTHGVIVGMTGSGKTGLSVIMLEEALLQGIPTLILDPKGDMGNLLLSFPELAPADFRPWINEADADRDGVSADEHAAATADMWRNGLDGWGIGPDRIKALRDTASFTIYTPGSTSGVPLNIIGDLAAPPAETDDETRNDEIEGFVSSLLGLIGVDA
ncbi:MAG: helicase HerA domain-containing protein, partial [Acidimicrobiales bacterium]